MVNQINEIEDKDLFLRVQEMWSKKYPNLTLIVLDDKDDKAYRFTWEVNTPHVQNAIGRWQSVSKDKLKGQYIDNYFIYNIEILEKEFTACAIEHYLRSV